MTDEDIGINAQAAMAKKIKFPSNELTLHDIRQADPENVFDSYDPKLPKKLYDLIVCERGIAADYWLLAKKGADFREPHAEETVAEGLEERTKQLREYYDEFHLCQGDHSFNHELKAIREQAESLAKTQAR